MKNVYSYIKNHLTILILVVVNAYPIIGVYYYGWDLFLLLYLYWGECIIIGFLNIFKILLASKKEKGGKYLIETEYKILTFRPKTISEIVERKQSKLYITVNFILVYMFSMFVYGLFLGLIFGTFSNSLGNVLDNYSQNISVGFIYAIFLMLLSHSFSFIYNFILKKEYLEISPARQYTKPLGRIFAMHFIIMLGGIITKIIGSPMPALVFLVIVKLVLDLFSHSNEHFEKKVKIIYKGY